MSPFGMGDNHDEDRCAWDKVLDEIRSGFQGVNHRLDRLEGIVRTLKWMAEQSVRVATLETALRQYGGHWMAEPGPACGVYENPPSPCTCGLDAALTPPRDGGERSPWANWYCEHNLSNDCPECDDGGSDE